MSPCPLWRSPDAAGLAAPVAPAALAVRARHEQLTVVGEESVDLAQHRHARDQVLDDVEHNDDIDHADFGEIGLVSHAG